MLTLLSDCLARCSSLLLWPYNSEKTTDIHLLRCAYYILTLWADVERRCLLANSFWQSRRTWGPGQKLSRTWVSQCDLYSTSHSSRPSLSWSAPSPMQVLDLIVNETRCSLGYTTWSGCPLKNSTCHLDALTENLRKIRADIGMFTPVCAGLHWSLCSWYLLQEFIEESRFPPERAYKCIYVDVAIKVELQWPGSCVPVLDPSRKFTFKLTFHDPQPLIKSIPHNVVSINGYNIDNIVSIIN